MPSGRALYLVGMTIHRISVSLIAEAWHTPPPALRALPAAALTGARAPGA